LELWLGPDERGSLFDTREQLLQAWRKHKGEVMARWGTRCRRGWWELETDLEYPGYEAEPGFLYARNLLSPEEWIQFETQRSQKKGPHQVEETEQGPQSA
jgi:hypothetical protein